jgi:hypothetical protein
MKIRISKKENRNILTCIRNDGSYTKVEVNATLPHHDMAHYVIETAFRLKQGFYGMIEKGYSIEELSDKQVIKTLGPESWVAEILTRALQSLSSGACKQEEFASLVKEELGEKAESIIFLQTPAKINELLDSFSSVLNQWNEIHIGGSLELTFE